MTTQDLFGALRAALQAEPLDFQALCESAEAYRLADLAHYKEVGLPYVRQCLTRDYDASPLYVERKFHWTNSNQNVLVDPFKLTLRDERVLELTTDVHVPGLELARSVCVLNKNRWNKARLGPKHGKALASHPLINGLKGIEVQEQKLGAKGVSSWMNQAEFEDLRALVFNGGVVREAGAGAIASCASLKNLEILVLSQGRIAAGGAELLAASPYLTSLRELVLDENQLTVSGVEALAQSDVMSHIVRLELNSNKELGASGVIALTKSKTLTSLKHLGLMGVNMRNKGAEALIESELFTRLESVALGGGNHISDAYRAVVRTRAEECGVLLR